MLVVKGWTPDVDGASPPVLSLDSGRAMVCARYIEIDFAIKLDDGGSGGSRLLGFKS